MSATGIRATPAPSPRRSQPRASTSQGIRIDGGAVPSCSATDAEFRAMGRDACPVASRVGTGRLVAITGFGAPVDPVEGDVTVFNGGDELTEVVFAKGTNTVLGMDRLEVRGNRLVAHPPATPGGPPDGRTSIRSIDLELPARRGSRGRPFVRAPGACPADGSWRSTARYRFADGGSTTLTSETPCGKRAQAPAEGDPVCAAPPRACLSASAVPVHGARSLRPPRHGEDGAPQRPHQPAWPCIATPPPRPNRAAGSPRQQAGLCHRTDLRARAPRRK